MEELLIGHGERRLAAQYWYAVHCKPYKEYQARTALIEQLGIVVYLPELRGRIRGRERRVPLFPGYLFVRLDLQRVVFSAINRTPGVNQMVMFGGEPPHVPDDVIDALRQSVDGLNRSGGLSSHRFQKGQPLRFRAGPLRGLEAVFLGPMRPRDRIRVLVDFLGSLREAEVDVDLVESVASQPRPAPTRRTRGKGRQIKLKS